MNLSGWSLLVIAGHCWSQVLEEVPQEEVRLNVIRRGVGPVTQSDVEAAAEAEAPVFAFNVKAVGPDVKVGDGLLFHAPTVPYVYALRPMLPYMFWGVVVASDPLRSRTCRLRSRCRSRGDEDYSV